MKAEALKDTPLEVARRRRAQTIVRSASQLARRSGRTRARQVASFIEAHAELATPIVGGGLSYPAARSPLTFYIAPITGSDGILPSSDEYVQMFAQPAKSGPYGAIYLNSNRTIYIPIDWPISPFWAHLTLLHEGSHAVDWLTGRADALAFWEQEVRARRLEGSVLLGLYGRRLDLDHVLERLLPDVETAAETGSLRDYAPTDRVDVELAKVFGRPIGRYDLDEQREAVRKLALQRYLRRVRAGPELWRQSVPDDADA